MLLSDTNQAMLKHLRNLSGCNGRFIQSYENLSQVRPMLLKLKAKWPPKAPTPQDLISLWQPPFQQQMITSISLYLGGYLFFFTLVIWRIKQTSYLLLLPALVAAAGVLTWTGKGNNHLLSWAETESGDNYNRISSLLMLGIDRRGENTITLGSKTRLSNFMDRSQTPNIHYLQENGQRKLSGQTRLLLPQAYYLTSISRQAPQFLLTVNSGRPEVTFLGKESPAETRLLWRGHSYTVPILSQGGRWQPETSGQNPASPAEYLLNRHLAFGDPALLLPFSPAQTETINTKTQNTGWLVIRHNPEQTL